MNTRYATGSDDRGNDGALAQARRRAGAKLGLSIHALVFVAVNTGLWLVWALGTPNAVAWPRFPLLGWGLGLAIHAAVVWLSLAGVRERMIERELARIEQRGGRRS